MQANELEHHRTRRTTIHAGPDEFPMRTQSGDRIQRRLAVVSVRGTHLVVGRSVARAIFRSEVSRCEFFAAFLTVVAFAVGQLASFFHAMHQHVFYICGGANGANDGANEQTGTGPILFGTVIACEFVGSHKRCHSCQEPFPVNFGGTVPATFVFQHC